MQISEFIEATSRLETYYNKDYTNEQRQIMFEELKEIDIERYKKLISVVIRKSKFLPKVADLIEADIEEPYTSKIEDKEKIEFKKCNSTGYIVYNKTIKDGRRDFTYQFASICSCGNAQKYEGWNVSDKRFRSEFYTPLAVELGIRV